VHSEDPTEIRDMDHQLQQQERLALLRTFMRRDLAMSAEARAALWRHRVMDERHGTYIALEDSKLPLSRHDTNERNLCYN
jgi:hypothetical protein